MRFNLVLAGLMLAGNACATDAIRAQLAPVPANLDREVSARMKQARAPGVAIARISNGRLAWTRTWGERAAGEPLGDDTVFNVASLTKPAFAMMTLHLVADGELGLDTPLADDWVDPDIADDPRRDALTPRIALSHQTGFQNWRGNRSLAFAFAPGERHEYSGEGFEYLRRAIEHKTGQTMPALMHEHVVTAAGMTSTYFGWDDRVDGHVATGFRESGQPYDMASLRERGPNAAANMLTTIGDYGRFTAWVARGAGLPEPVFEDMQRPQAMHPEPAENFGLGWRVSEAGNDTVLSHDGRENGVRTQVFVFPASGDGLVILTNSDNGELLTRPLVMATLAQGPALLEAIDQEIWAYLQRMPTGQVAQIGQMIARSPAFMSKLLHAVDSTLLRESGLDADARDEACAAIEPFVSAMLDGHVGPSQAAGLVAMLIETDETTGARWRTAFSPAQARDWQAALGERRDGRTTRATPSSSCPTAAGKRPGGA